MAGLGAFLLGFLMVFVLGFVIYAKIRFDVDLLYNDDEEWD
tara:strand:- start:78 stop:200 length:123 start_codon:yes stop_codon:yes gene_type:complete